MTKKDLEIFTEHCKNEVYIDPHYYHTIYEGITNLSLFYIEEELKSYSD